MILSVVLSMFLVSDSFTLSPLSFTYHNFDDKAVEAFYKYKLGKNTTAHPGLHLKYETGYFQTGAWYFLDSFGRHAGGAMMGPKVDLWWFEFGAVGGVYARQENRNNPMKFPFTWRVGAAAIAPLGGATGAVRIPVGGSARLEIGCMSAWLVTNCSIGVNVKWQ